MSIKSLLDSCPLTSVEAIPGSFNMLADCLASYGKNIPKFSLFLIGLDRAYWLLHAFMQCGFSF